MNKKAFTLIELIVIIAIIAILAAIIVPNAFTAIEKAKISKALADVKSINTAALGFYTDLGLFPGSQLTYGFDGSPITTIPGDPFGTTGYGVGFVTPPVVNPAAPDVSPERFAMAYRAVTEWDGPYLDKWDNAPWGAPYTWSYNDYDSNGNSLEWERGVWFDLNIDSKKVPEPTRIKIDQKIDVVNNFSRGNIVTIYGFGFGNSLFYIISESTDIYG